MLIEKLKRTYRKRRGVSPIIAAIILIALAVFAGAAVYFIVLPFLTPTTNIGNISVAKGNDPSTVGVLADFTACNSCSKSITFSILVTNSGTKDTSFNVSSVTLTNTTNGSSVGAAYTTLTVKTGSSGGIVTGATPLPAGQGTVLTISFSTTSGNWLAGTYQISVDLAFGSPISSSKAFTPSGLTFTLN